MARGQKDSSGLQNKTSLQQKAVPQNNPGACTATSSPDLQCDGAIGGEIDNYELPDVRDPQQTTDSSWKQLDESEFLEQEVILHRRATQTPASPCDGAIGGREIDNYELSDSKVPQQKTDSNRKQLDENEFTEQEINTLCRIATQTQPLPVDGAIGGREIENYELSDVKVPQQNTDSNRKQLDESEFLEQEVILHRRGTGFYNTDDPDSAGTHATSRLLIQDYFRTQLNDEASKEGKVVPSGTSTFTGISRKKADEDLYPSGGDFKNEHHKQGKLWNDIPTNKKYLEHTQMKEIHNRHQEERKKNPEEDCGPIHHHKVEHQELTEMEVNTLKEYAGQSLGQIMFKDEFVGTCFCVRRSDYQCQCLTALHVLKTAIAMTKHGTEEECYQYTTVQFPWGRFNMKHIEPPEINLDYSLFELKLKENNRFPLAWKKFGSVPRDINQSIYIVGYQHGVINWDFTAVLMNISVSEGLNKIKGWYREKFPNKSFVNTFDNKDMKHHFVISTKLLPGSSGGLVIKKNENGEFVGIGMVICGYPNEYYSKLSLEEKAEVKGCYLFELALSFDNLKIKQLLFCNQH